MFHNLVGAFLRKADYNHGKKLWDDGNCSKYLVALIMDGVVVDYNRPDYWNFKNPAKYAEETKHFSTWDYQKNSCPYKDRAHHEGESKEYISRMCKVISQS